MNLRADPATRAVRAAPEYDAKHGAVVPPLFPSLQGVACGS